MFKQGSSFKPSRLPGFFLFWFNLEFLAWFTYLTTPLLPPSSWTGFALAPLCGLSLLSLSPLSSHSSVSGFSRLQPSLLYWLALQPRARLFDSVSTPHSHIHTRTHSAGAALSTPLLRLSQGSRVSRVLCNLSAAPKRGFAPATNQPSRATFQGTRSGLIDFPYKWVSLAGLRAVVGSPVSSDLLPFHLFAVASALSLLPLHSASFFTLDFGRHDLSLCSVARPFRRACRRCKA